MSFPPNIVFESTDDENPRDVQVADVQPNFQAIERNFELFQIAFNALNAAAQAGSGSGGASTAAEVSVSRANFDQLLANFTGTQAQELFDFIDGLDIAAPIPPTATITLFASPQLSGRNEDIKTLISTQNITISYRIGVNEDLASLRLVVNGVIVPIALPITGDGVFNNFLVELTASTRSAIISQIQNNQIVSFLQGVRVNETVIESGQLVLDEGGEIFANDVYYDFTVERVSNAFEFSNDRRITPNSEGAALFTTEPAPFQNPSADDPGQRLVIAFPFTQDIQLVSIANRGVIENFDLIETTAFPSPELNDRGTPDGRSYDFYFSGPLVEGAIFDLTVTLRGL